MYKRFISLKKSVLFILPLLVSCQTVDLGEESAESQKSTESSDAYSVSTQMTLTGVWTSNTPGVQSKAVTTAESCYMYYIFNSDGSALCNAGNLANAMQKSLGFPAYFHQITRVGTYTLYGILNISRTEYVSVSTNPGMTTSQTFTLTEPRDICLGSQSMAITADKINYTVNVTVEHIMAKLALSVKGVPSDITSLKVILPEESNVFNLKGEFSGSSKADTLAIVKANTANSDGTYDWSVLDQGASEEIVYPCILTSMPITIVAEDAGKTYTFNTSSDIVCSSGTRTNLSTTWSTITNVEAEMTVSPWAGSQQTGVFDMGDATVE